MKEFRKINELDKGEEVWINDIYQVVLREDENVTWLSIKRIDKECIHDWREMQLIKNMLTDPEREGVEIYPAESRLVDTSNQFHLFVLPKGERVPFGYGDRLVVSGQKGSEGNIGQREFNEGEAPDDIITPQEARERAKDFAIKQRLKDVQGGFKTKELKQ